MRKSRSFTFDGGAATYWGIALLAFLVTVCTIGIMYPFGLVMRLKWRSRHTLIDGRRLEFVGTATGLVGNWLKWLMLCIITVGIYTLWIGPRINKWVVEHTDFEPTPMPQQQASGAALQA